MKSFAYACVLLAACMSSYDDQYPVSPGAPGGAGGTSGGSTPSTGTGSGDDAGTGQLQTMKVCLAQDLRSPTTGCETSNLSDLQVQLGNQIATTDTSGQFQMVAPTTVGQTFRVTGQSNGTTVNTIAPVTQAMIDNTMTAAELVIPSARSTTLDALAASNAVVVNQSAGQLFLNAANANGTGVAEIEAASDQSTAQLFYEGDATTWSGQSTGVHGAVWLTNATVGQVSLTLSRTGSNPLTISNLPIQAGATTFVTAQVP